MRHTADHTEEVQMDPIGPRCLATLEPLEEEGLSLRAQYDLSGSRTRFPSRIDLVREDVSAHRRTSMQRMSISGMQDKISVRLEKGQLVPVESNGTHILKPVPSTPLKNVHDVPANEALTMLLARDAGIRTAAFGLVRMQDGELAYVTRRFDRIGKDQKLHQEDFGALAGMSEAASGPDWKYDSSYEKIGHLVATYCSARDRDLAEYFRRVLFNFACGNGDAHLRNFSILRAADGFVEISPAYDLLSTPVHLPNDGDTALSLLEAERDGNYSAQYNALGFYSASDFLTLGDRIGVAPQTARSLVDYFTSNAFMHRSIERVRNSFLSEEACELYSKTIVDRVQKISSKI